MENRGQLTDVVGKAVPEVLFTAHSGNTDIFVTATGIYYQFTKHIYTDVKKTSQAILIESLPISVQSYRFNVSLVGSSGTARVIAEEPVNSVTNFYLPQCHEGLTGVRSFKKITLKEVYPGIDWVLFSEGAHLKYDFVVHKHSDAKNIRLSIANAECSISREGCLEMRTPMGMVKEQSPLSYQADKRIASRFVINTDGNVNFDLQYDRNKELVIDPSISWASYFGGADDDRLYSSATDTAGNIYVSGLTYGPSALSTPGAYQSSNVGGIHNFIAKFDANGQRIWCTCFGDFAGIAYHTVSTLRLDACGNIYLAGSTSSTTGIATAGAYQTIHAGNDEGFLAKFTNSGTRIWASYFGGSLDDQIEGLALDGHGGIFISGYTRSTSGISSPGAYQTTYAGGFRDVFLAKFDSDGSRIWSTYYGGSDDDMDAYCCVDPSGNPYLCGITVSLSGIATLSSHQPSFGGNRDAFLAKFSSSGVRKWSTYYGGSSIDDGHTCTTDFVGNVYIGGYTGSTNAIATLGSFQTVKRDTWDGFLVKFDSTGTRLWGSYYGSDSTESLENAITDQQGNVYISGFTKSISGYASAGAFQPANGGGLDAYIAKISPGGNRIWGSYLGATGDEAINSCSINKGKITAVGYASSTSGVATPGSYQTSYGGGIYDGFIWSITDTIRTITASIAASFCGGDTVRIPFVASGSFYSGNTFTAQLSDSNGFFSSAANIGSVSGTTSGFITAIIPTTAVASNSYRIRVNSSSPIVSGNDYGGSACARFAVCHRASTQVPAISSTEKVIKAFPNPFSREIVVEGLKRGDLVSVTDLAGKLFMKAVFDSRPVLSLDHLPPGMYFLTIFRSASNEQWHLKIEKN